MRTRKITEDFIVVEKAASPSTLIGRVLARALRNRKKAPEPPSPPSRSRSKEYEKRKALRLFRRKNGLCTTCPQGDQRKPEDSHRACLRCRLRWRTYNSRRRSKQVLSLTPCPLRIDLD